MPTTITTDRSKQVIWNARKANDQSITLLFQESSVDFDITNYTFTLGIYRQVDSTAIITLTQGSGLTNGGVNGELLVTFTDTQLDITPDEYFLRLSYVHSGNNYLLLNGKFIVNNGYWDGAVTTSTTITVSLATTEVTMNVSLPGETTSVYSTTSTASLTPDLLTYDAFKITAIAEALTINNPATAPNDFDIYIIRITDNGTGRALSFGNKFRAQGSALPTTTTANKTMVICFIYDSDADMYDTKYSEEV